MKLSITLSAIILIVVAAFAWRDQHQLGSISSTNDKLAAEATTQGITPADTASARKQRNERPGQANAAQAHATDFLGLYRQIQNTDPLDKKALDDLYTQRGEILKKICQLSAPQIKTLLAELRAAIGLDEGIKEKMMLSVVSAIADTQPRTALDFLMEWPDLKTDMEKYYKKKAITSWAKDDPLGAVDWLRDKRKTHPDPINDFEAFLSIAGEVYTPEQRAAVYSALRDQNEKPPSALFYGRVIAELAFSASGSMSGFEEASAWIDSAKLSEKEFEVATENIILRLNPKENGKWIEWMGNSGMSEELAKKRVVEITKSWTARDYRAIGQWLTTAPESPGKTIATATYAATVYPYDP